MLSFRLAAFAFSGCVVALVLNGCGSSAMNSMSGVGQAPTVANIGLQVNGVAPNRTLYMQFNEAMDPATINGQTIVVKSSSGAAATGTVAYNASFDIASFQPSPALQGDASYTLVVSTGVASASGVHLQSEYSYGFTTRATADESPIYVKSVTPAPDATCVSASTPVTITFNEGADVNTLTSTDIFITGPGGTPIGATLGYDSGTAAVTLTPTLSLPTGTITVTVQNVADAAGVAMTTPYRWSFSTACNGGSGGGTGTVQYQAPILAANTLNTVKGKVSVDTVGNTTVELNTATSNGSYTVQFCPAVDPLSSNTNVPCFKVMTISTDSSGNGTATAKFPQSGNWAGDFFLNNASGTAEYQTWLAPGVNNEVFQAKLLPETTTNGGADTSSSPQDPLTSGTVTYANGSLTFTVKGAEPSTSYTTVESETNYIHSSGSYAVSTLTTDASGNGISTSPMSSSGGDMLDVVRANAAGFIGGFTIP